MGTSYRREGESRLCSRQSVVGLARLKTFESTRRTRSSPYIVTKHCCAPSDSWTWIGNTAFLNDALEDLDARPVVVFLRSGACGMDRTNALRRAMLASRPKGLAVSVLAHEIAYILSRRAGFEWMDDGNLRVVGSAASTSESESATAQVMAALAFAAAGS